jgi:hypothetical protein
MKIVEGLIEPKSEGLDSNTFLPWHFIVVNDGNKPNPILSQTMHCTQGANHL